MMQTSSAYEYDFIYEHATCMDCWDTREEDHGDNKNVIEETTMQCGMNKDGKLKRRNAKQESREEKIKRLKALVRKQEKAINKLTDAHTSERKNSGTNRSSAKKGYTRQRLNPRGRKSRKKLDCCDSIASTREVDIWMSRGDLITKDEFLAVVGLVRVAKFH